MTTALKDISGAPGYKIDRSASVFRVVGRNVISVPQDIKGFCKLVIIDEASNQPKKIRVSVQELHALAYPEEPTPEMWPEKLRRQAEIAQEARIEAAKSVVKEAKDQSN